MEEKKEIKKRSFLEKNKKENTFEKSFFYLKYIKENDKNALYFRYFKGTNGYVTYWDNNKMGKFLYFNLKYFKYFFKKYLINFCNFSNYSKSPVNKNNTIIF